MDSDPDTNSHVPGSSSGRVGCNALLLMEKKVMASTPHRPSRAPRMGRIRDGVHSPFQHKGRVCSVFGSPWICLRKAEGDPPPLKRLVVRPAGDMRLEGHLVQTLGSHFFRVLKPSLKSAARRSPACWIGVWVRGWGAAIGSWAASDENGCTSILTSGHTCRILSASRLHLEQQATGVVSHGLNWDLDVVPAIPKETKGK